MNPTAEAQFERTFSVNGPVTLDVSTTAGLILIRRGQDSCVSIRGVLRAHPSLFSWSHPEEKVLQLAANPPVHQDGNTIRIGDVIDRWLLRRVCLRLDITAPAETTIRALGDSAALRVEGINGPIDCETDAGEIQISGAAAPVSAWSDAGAIHIRDVTASVDARSDSGRIEALEIGGEIDVHTDSGSIRLSQTVAGPIYANSDSGRISVKLAKAAGYTIGVRTDRGRIDIPELAQSRSCARETEGVIRGGGPAVYLETDSGDIDVL